MTAATPAQPAPVSPHLECAVCASGVTTPHGAGGTPGQAALPPLPPKWTGKFRKLPIVIEAVQLTNENIVDVMRWVAPAAKIGQAVDVTIDIDKGLTVATLEGDMTASFGDWVIRGVKGEFYPCKPDIFDATYEPAAQEPHAAPGESSPLGLKHAVTSNRLGHALAALREIRDGDDALHELVERARTALDDDAAIRDNVMLTPEPKPAPELAAPIVLNMDASGPAQPYEATLIPERIAEPVAAPELAATQELAAARAEVIEDMLSRFGPSGSGHTARVGQVQIAKWRTRAGLTS